LLDEPKARERKNKNRAIKHILAKKYPSLRSIDPGVLQEAVKKSQSLDRSWRKLLEENPKLRGKDYDNKQEQERVSKHRLGYNV